MAKRVRLHLARCDWLQLKLQSLECLVQADDESNQQAYNKQVAAVLRSDPMRCPKVKRGCSRKDGPYTV